MSGLSLNDGVDISSLEILHGLSGIEILEGVSLSDYTTFRLGGRCRAMVSCSSPEILQKALVTLSQTAIPYVLIGGGSNILVSDHGYDGVVVRFVDDHPSFRVQEGNLDLSGASSLDEAARWTAEQGWSGIMCCTGIPGTVGGAIVGNAGAWGEQIADHLEQVELASPEGHRREESPGALRFSYRNSGLKDSGEVVLKAKIQVKPADPGKLGKEREKILQKRAERHPDLPVDPCIGSFFRNIEPTSATGRHQAAGWYLEQAGAKALQVGGARVFERHANIIVNKGGCTAQNVFDLSIRMAENVKEKFGLDLVREVRLLGTFEGAPASDHRSFT